MVESFTKINTSMYDNTFLNKYNYLSSVYQNVLPNNIKEIFKWTSFIVANVPTVQSALDKMSSIAITSINYLSKDLAELNQDEAMNWKSIVENKLNIKQELKEIAYNFLLYGNQFVSIHFPVDRKIVCRKCSSVFKRKEVEHVKIEPVVTEDKQLLFKGKCPECRMDVVFDVKDEQHMELDKLKIIKWPVNRIELYEDEITGVKTFYYTPLAHDKELLEKGNKDKLFNLPKDIIIASLKEGKVKFNDNAIYHIRTRKLNATDTSWGMPMLTSAIPDMISLMLLRKTNEKIYSDMMLPFRGVVPRVQGVDNNPAYNYINADDMKKKINGILKSWKKDPTGIKFFPIPLEPINLFGEGKALNLAAEIDSYTTMIMQAVGVPVEFVKGGLSYSGAGASLRVLQNQLMELTTSLELVANFIIKRVSSYIKKEPVRVKLIPIKLIDDISDKQNMIAMMQANKVSNHTALNFFDIDYREEQQRILEEQKADIRRQLELQRFQQTVATDLEDKIKQESMMQNSSAWNLNQSAILQEADGYVQQYSQLDPGLLKSKMDELAKENPVLYAVVKWRMEFMKQKQETEAKKSSTITTNTWLYVEKILKFS